MASRAGIPNKSTMRVEMTCQIRNFNAIEGMIDAAELALVNFTDQLQKEATGRISPMESQACEYLKIYVKICSDIANFIHPRRKAIEVKQSDLTKDMTPQQKLEAMKSAVAMLELQMKKE